MKVYWTLEARARLLDIHSHIAKDSPQSARRVVAKLLNRSAMLALPPLLGRHLPEYPDEDLREVLERPYRLVFRVVPGAIEIVTVKHYRQKLPAHPMQLSP